MVNDGTGRSGRPVMVSGATDAAMWESSLDRDTYSMPSFRLWLEHRLQQVPDATSAAIAIARSGAAGVSREEMAKALGVPSESLKPLLRATVVAGQVEMLKVSGELRYRMAG